MRHPTAKRPARRPSPWRLVEATLLVAVVALGSLVRLASPPVTSRTPDEYAYTLYAGALARGERVHTADVLQFVERAPEAAEYPLPTRVGFLWPASALMRATGNAGVGTVALLSTLASVLALFLLAWIAAESLGPGPAAIAALFLATSPLDLAIARRAWQDDVLALLALAMLFAFLRFAAAPARWRWAAACLGLGGYLVLVKESGAALLAFATAGLSFVAWRETKGLGRPLAVALGGVAALGLAVGVLAWQCGGLAWLRELFVRVATAPPGEYVRKYQTGSPLYYVTGLAILHPLPFLLGYASAVLVAARPALALEGFDRPQARVTLITMAWYVLAFSALAAAFPIKSLRWLSVIYGPVYVLAAALVAAMLTRARRRLEGRAFALLVGAVAIALVLAALMDLRRFFELFARRRIPDLATPWFTGPPPGQ